MGEARRKEPARGAPRMVPLRKGNDLVTRKDLARAIMNYHVWRQRQVWWRRIPRNAWAQLRKLWARPHQEGAPA